MPHLNDLDPLIHNENSHSFFQKCRNIFLTHTRCFIFSFLLVVTILLNILVIYFIYFQNYKAVKMMALNVWGLPLSLGSPYKEKRIAAIGDIIENSDYDIVFLTELWMEADHTTIDNLTPSYTITPFRGLALSICDGRVLPTSCSGLAILTKFNQTFNLSFNAYSKAGHWDEMFVDGEWFVNKGFGRLSMMPFDDDITIDFFITHTIADAIPNHSYTNKDIRVDQVGELLRAVNESEADLVILAGDFNTPPQNTVGEPYHLIRQQMTNAIEEIYYKFQRWLQPDFATYGNKLNSFSNQSDPVIFDYFFFKTKPTVAAWTNIFELPFFRFSIQKGIEFSVSDHEAIHTTIYYYKRKIDN